MFGSGTANFQWIHWLYKTLVWVFPGGPVDKTPCLHSRGCGFNSLVREDPPDCGQKQQKKLVWSLTKLIPMNQERVVRAIHSWGWGGDDEGSFAHLISLESIRQTAFTALNVCVCMLSFSCVWLFSTLWTVAHQALLSMTFSRQEYWSRLTFPPPGDLPIRDPTQGPNPNPGIEPFPAWQEDSLLLEPPGKPL